MILHDDSGFRIYFGDIKDSCVKKKDQYSVTCFEDIRRNLQLDKLIFLKQVHGANGLCIDSPSFLKKTLSLFEFEGDFIITDQRNIGIGVVTADCLPVTLYDPVHHVVAIVHVGWRGVITKIIPNVLEKMHEVFNTNSAELIVYFGSSARVCCYEVQPDFLKGLESSVFTEQVILKKDGALFFNLPRLVRLQLVELGIPNDNIKREYNTCTICDLRFHSNRRSGENAGRQSTIIMLK